MKCMHCLVEFHSKKEFIAIGKDADGAWGLERYDCPACKRMNVYLTKGADFVTHSSPLPAIPIDLSNRVLVALVRPKGVSRPQCPAQVQANIAEDYTEACLVLPDSRKASAALSRRCLQNLLREAARVRPGNLADEIQQVIDSGQLPSTLAEAIDAVRNIGNFAAHPMKSKGTGEILPVEPQEAEWNLDVLEGLFDHFYVKPALWAEKRAALNTKLAEAGKPPVK